MTYISSQSLLSPVRQSITQAQSALSLVQTEISTGKMAQLGVQLGAGVGTPLSMQNEIDSLNGYTSSNALATNRLGVTATTLSAMLTSAQTISADLVTASSAGGSSSALQSNAQAALQSLVANLNTSSAGQYIFAGINTGQQPVSNYFGTPTSAAKQAVDAAFSQTFGESQTDPGTASITGTQMTAFLNGSFDAQFSASGWQTWSSASDTTINSSLTPEQTATTSVSANATAFRNLAEAYTMLSEFTGSTMSSDAQAAVVTKASSLLSAGIAGLIQTQSDVGTAQATISTANAQITARVSALTGNVSSIEDVDTYSLSTQLNTLQTQLEASYEMTSRLQQLSLVNYITE